MNSLYGEGHLLRDRAAWGFVALLLLIALAAALTPWRSAWTADDRTYLEMTSGVVRHGLPWTDNGPAEHFPELRARWNRPHDGRLWGIYQPFYAFVAAPAWALGGSLGVIRFNVLSLALVALATLWLSVVVTGSRRRGVLAAVFVSFLTSLPLMALVASPYTILVAAHTAALAAALQGLTRGGSGARRCYLLTGLLEGFALGVHLQALPLLMGLAAGLALEAFRGPVEASFSARLRGAAAIAGWVALGALPPVFVIAWINHSRVGTWNIALLNSCPWAICQEMTTGTLGNSVLYAAPILAIFALVGAFMMTVAHSRVSRVAVALATAALLLAVPALRERVFAMGTLLTALLIDVSPFDLGGSYFRTEDGLGQLSGYGVIKSLAQCTPVIVAALFGSWMPRRRGDGRVLLGLTAVVFYAMLSLRGFGNLRHELGEPYLYFRYNNLMLPLLAVMAVEALSALPWRRAHAVVGALVAVSLTAWLASERDDFALLRRLLLLRGTLIVALTLSGAMLLSRVRSEWARMAAGAAAVAIGMSLAIQAGSDLPGFGRLRTQQDDLLARIEASTPHHAAILGPAWIVDPVLASRVERDLVYADLGESRDPRSLRGVIDHWLGESRRVFVLGNPAPSRVVLGSDLGLVMRDPAVGLQEVIRVPGGTRPPSL